MLPTNTTLPALDIDTAVSIGVSDLFLKGFGVVGELVDGTALEQAENVVGREGES